MSSHIVYCLIFYLNNENGIDFAIRAFLVPSNSVLFSHFRIHIKDPMF